MFSWYRAWYYLVSGRCLLIIYLVLKMFEVDWMGLIALGVYGMRSALNVVG